MTGPVVILSAAQIAAMTPEEAEVYRQALEAQLFELTPRDISESPGALAHQLTRGRELDAPHLRKIDEAWQGIEAGTVRRVMVLMPPRHGKSRRASRWGPLWYLHRHPDRRLIHVSHSAPLAQDDSTWVRQRIREHPELGIALDATKQTEYRWRTRVADSDEGGGIHATGIGGTITGFGAHVLSIDDPHKDRRDADSPRIRQSVHEWYQSTALARLEPDAAILLTMQRWHEDDLAGRILAEEGSTVDGGTWLLIEVPALAEEGDPLGRPLGAALWPERYDETALAGLQVAMGPRGWASQYQQKPRPREGAFFAYDVIRQERRKPEETPALTTVGVYVDPSFSDDDAADETGVVVMGLGVDGDVYVLADLSVRAPFEEAEVPAAWRAHNASRVVVEQNLLGRRVLKDLRKQASAMPVRGLAAKGTKALRAEQAAAMYAARRVHHVGTFPELEGQMTEWRPTDDGSPDRMDALVHGIHDLLLSASYAQSVVQVVSPVGLTVPRSAAAGGR